uniref:SOWAHA-C winged helix-turn-helix domain-containing protein n=1 Tax=Esox lucius TaxID=8010 RepID=A0AAY5KXG3_ESOLU
MATDFTQDSVLHFLRSNGGRVKNSDLLAHFKPFIKDHENRTRNRELFKKFVNSVAVVKPEEGVSYVVLRKRIQGHVDGNIPVVSTPCISEGDVPVAASLVPFPCDPEVTLSNGSLDSDLQHKLQQQSRPKRDGVTIAPHYATPDSQPRQSNCSTVGGLQLQHRIQQQARPKQNRCPARQNRLHLLSSNLGIGHSFSTPSSRTHSCRDLREDVRSRASSNRSLSSSHDGSYFHRHSQVPLEPNEHDWLVKSATGTWPDVYDLFRDDPSLLTKRDFITGYNILHWIAKHGDHRVLNTLAYGVDKAGLKLDVDAKTACGYTALHLAALHGNKQMVRLLVHKFRANVALRDTSGKKAWQYLSGPKDLLELLGAPNCSTPASSSTPQSPLFQSNTKNVHLRFRIWIYKLL